MYNLSNYLNIEEPLYILIQKIKKDVQKRQIINDSEDLFLKIEEDLKIFVIKNMVYVRERFRLSGCMDLPFDSYDYIDKYNKFRNDIEGYLKKAEIFTTIKIFGSKIEFDY